MQKQELTEVKQRKMILRCIAEIEDLSKKAFKEEFVEDFYELENSSQLLKEFARDHVTIVGMQKLIASVPCIREQIVPREDRGISSVIADMFRSRPKDRIPNAHTIHVGHDIYRAYMKIKREILELENRES